MQEKTFQHPLRQGNVLRKPFLAIALVYGVCVLFRLFEYFVLRTDQTVLGEAFVHKIAGFVLLLIVLRAYAIAPSGIGFIRKTALRNSLYGVLLGAVAFIPAYAADLLLTRANGQVPGLSLYVSAFSASGNFGNQTGAIFFAICVAGNIINVLMEEGVFRGLFLRLAESKTTFPRAVLLSSVLFGLWHIVGPIREWVDGDRSASGAVMMALVMVITTAITGTKFCLLVKWSGSLWTAMADHFFNNTITNILHVVTPAGADEMMTLRIAIAQLLSLAIVIILFVRSKAREKETFRVAVPAA